jgi:hypothetical protein
VQVDFTFHAIAVTIISKSGDVAFTNATDSELEGIALPHAVNVMPLKPFTGRLRFCLDSNEKTMFLENTMDRSPGAREIELVLDP